MRIINEELLRQQANLGKVFRATHPIATATRSFGKEIKFLASIGKEIIPLI